MALWTDLTQEERGFSISTPEDGCGKGTATFELPRFTQFWRGLDEEAYRGIQDPACGGSGGPFSPPSSGAASPARPG